MTNSQNNQEKATQKDLFSPENTSSISDEQPKACVIPERLSTLLDTQKPSPPKLKPMKYPQNDLFVCDITDVILKDDMASMEHPFYSLSKKPDRNTRRYEHNGKWIEFRPSIKGLPTIYDKDLIIYAISHLIAGLEEGDEVPKTVEIDPYSFFLFTERGTGGRDYESLCDSLDRIDGTRYRTNVVFDGGKKDEWMGIIDKAALETDEKTNRPKKLWITLSDMIIEAIKDRKNVLTLHKDYFRLRKPMERRIYELARKHCGAQENAKFNLSTLHIKSGSKASLREFRRGLKSMVKENALPDYVIEFDDEKDQVIFKNREKWWDKRKQSGNYIHLKPDTYQEARSVAPSYDIYYLEQEWRSWWHESGEPDLKSPDKAFIAFCAKRYKNKPSP